MKFIEAVKTAKEGQEIRRKSWELFSRDTKILRTEDGIRTYKPGVSRFDSNYHFLFTIEDLEADNWVVEDIYL